MVLAGGVGAINKGELQKYTGSITDVPVGENEDSQSPGSQLPASVLSVSWLPDSQLLAVVLALTLLTPTLLVLTLLALTLLKLTLILVALILLALTTLALTLLALTPLGSAGLLCTLLADAMHFSTALPSEASGVLASPLIPPALLAATVVL